MTETSVNAAGNEPKRAHASLMRSFGYAGRGIWHAVKSERNIKIHLVAFGGVVLGGFAVKLAAWEWVSVLTYCAMVLGAELMNTGIETVIDLVSPAYNVMAGRAKDIAAAAVLVVSLFSVAIGLIVFGHAVARLAS